MGKEIIINAEKKQTRIAIVENRALAELHYENPENARTLGDIYVGRVRSIRPSIKAAFVDIGQKQDAFLHFSDLAENLAALLAYVDEASPQVARFHQSWIKRHGDQAEPSAPDVNGGKRAAKTGLGDSSGRGRRRGSSNELKRGQRILVRIVKEPISTKGSRVSSRISLAGRFLVLVPLANYTAVSKKISTYKERRRLRALAKMLQPEGFGVIVRTVAEGKDAKSLDTDMRLLRERWRKIEEQLENRPQAPVKVHEDVSMASSIIRDLFSSDYDRILVDDLRMYRKIRTYIQAVAPQMVSAVKLHKAGKHIFATTGLEKDIDEVFNSHVDLPSGGYLILERTEAMHVIDVNSGRSGQGLRQEESALKVNLEAALVLARQIRLRDLGGIIVVDFIDMRQPDHRHKVYEELEKQFRIDRAVTNLLPMSEFGLMQITRQRHRPSITSTFSGVDAPDGDLAASGGQPPRRRSAAPSELTDAIEAWLKAYGDVPGAKSGVYLHVHPFTAAYLKAGLASRALRWRFKFSLRVRIEEDASLHPMTFRCIDMDSGKDITHARKPVKGGVTATMGANPELRPAMKPAAPPAGARAPKARGGSRPAPAKTRAEQSKRGPRAKRPPKKTPSPKGARGGQGNAATVAAKESVENHSSAA